MLRYVDTSLKITFNPQGVEFKSSDPDDEDLRSFLTVFRQFISNDEPVNLRRIHSLCYQHMTSDKLKARLIEAREGWKRNLINRGFVLDIDGHEFTPEQLTECWINGFYFHNDIEQFNMLRRLAPHARLLARNFFLNHIVGTTGVILYYGHVIKIVLRESLIRI